MIKKYYAKCIIHCIILSLRFKDLPVKTIKILFRIEETYNPFLENYFINGNPYTYYHIINLVNIVLNDKDISEKDINIDNFERRTSEHLIYAYKYGSTESIEYLIKTNPVFNKFGYSYMDIQNVLGITNYFYYNDKLVPEYKSGLNGNWKVKVLDKSYSFKELEIKYEGDFENFKLKVNSMLGDHGCLIINDNNEIKTIFKDELDILDDLDGFSSNPIFEYENFLDKTFKIFQIYEIK